MKRVMVFGGSGSGKSTLARKIGQITGLPVVHIDPMYYRPGWEPRPKPETRALVLEATAQAAWVFDGNHHSTFPQRLERVDHVIWLDLPTWLRLWRVVARTWRYRGQPRPDMAPGCPERFDFEFIFKWVGGYRWRSRPADASMMANLPPHCKGVHLKNRAQVNDFIQQLTENSAAV